MATGLALCMGYLAIADGMFEDIFEALVSKQLGHAQLHHPRWPRTRALFDTLDDASDLERKLRALPEVSAVSARVIGAALLAAGDESGGGQLIGVVPRDEDEVRELRRSLVEGSYLPDTPGHQVLVGKELATRLRIGVGSELVAVTQAADGSLGNEIYKVAGLLRTGSAVLDKTAVFLHLEDAQALFALEGRVHEIAVMAPDREHIDAMVAAVKAAAARPPHPSDTAHDGDGVLVRSWAEVNPSAYQMISLQDAMNLLVALLIFGLAGLGILNTMLMSVFERTKELGVLIALGFKPRQVLLLILAETLLLTATSILIGLLAGGLLDAWLVVHGLD